jgi:hypothetical protein
VLRRVEAEIRKQGGERAVIWTDMLECTGSRRVYVPAMSELNALGLLDVERFPKRLAALLLLVNFLRQVRSL